MDAVTKAVIATACFTGVIAAVTVLYWIQTKRLWEVTRNTLVVDLLMRMLLFEPKGDSPIDWKKWALSFNVALGAGLSKELGDKLAEIVRIMDTIMEEKMTNKTKKDYERVTRILRGEKP